MKLSDDSIDRLRSSVNRLVEKSVKLEKDNQKLTKFCAEQQQELEATKKRLDEATIKLNAMSVGHALIEVSGGTTVARQRVNNLLRDIDRCISLVNK